MGSRPLPEGWDLPIPDAIWPETLTSAVRHNVDAHLSPRAIASIKGWHQDALDESEHVAAEGRRWLLKLGEALIPHAAPETDESVFDAESQPTAFYLPNARPESEEPGSGTVDAFHLPPVPTNLRSRGAESERGTVDGAQIKDLGEPRVTGAGPAHTGESRPNSQDFEDERPTTAFEIPDDAIPPPPPLPPPIPIDDETSGSPVADPSLIQDETDGGPTRHIALPDRVLLARLDSAEEALLQSAPERTQKAEVPAEPTEFLAKIEPQIVNNDLDLSTRPPSIIESKLGSADPEPLSGPRRVAPKPGVIRRSSHGARKTSSPRPRAAMHHVRTLHGLLLRFVEELEPLSYERRSRRFWARWREVAGDRGVRRDFVEELLKTATDTRTLICELIAGMQSAGPASVYQLVDKLGDEAPHLASQPVDSPAQPLPELLGASVRVDPEDS